MYSRTIQSLETWLTQDQTGSVVMVRFCLPDKYSGQHCRFSLRYHGQWTELSSGVFKGKVPGDAIYSYFFLTSSNEQPEAIRIESWGAGGIGIAYVQVRTQAGTYRPVSVLETQGTVRNAEYILDNDVKSSTLGERDTLVTFRNRAAYQQVHRLTCELIKVLLPV